MEFVIAQERTKRSPLVLSEFMGISQHMADALQVNPWDLGVRNLSIRPSLCDVIDGVWLGCCSCDESWVGDVGGGESGKARVVALSRDDSHLAHVGCGPCQDAPLAD